MANRRVMPRKDRIAAATALIAWFKSQEISVGDGLVIMAETMCLVLGMISHSEATEQEGREILAEMILKATSKGDGDAV